MERSKGQAWLYTQGEESIRLIRDTTGLMLMVCGPGPTEHVHTFDSKATLEEFLGWYEARLDADGWVLQRFVDRRREKDPGAVPPGADRRRCTPAPPPS
jgi:hypothetical protein